MIQWSTEEEFVHLVRSGQLTLRAGQRLTHRQICLLGMTQTLPMSQVSQHGAPGSRSALDAAQAQRNLDAAQAHRSRELAAAAEVSGSPESRIAAKIHDQLAQSPTWHALEKQRLHHAFTNANLDPVHGIAAKLERQHLPGVHAESGGISKRMAQRILRQYSDAEVRPDAQDTPILEERLAAIAKRLEAVEVLLKRWLGETAHPDLVTKPLAMTRQIRKQIRSLVAVA